MRREVYKGGNDVIRTHTYQWEQFNDDGTELIVGKAYDIITTMAAQWVYIMKDGEMVQDNSGERYLYLRVRTEKGREIYVWDGFFDLIDK